MSEPKRNRRYSILDYRPVSADILPKALQEELSTVTENRACVLSKGGCT